MNFDHDATTNSSPRGSEHVSLQALSPESRLRLALNVNVQLAVRPKCDHPYLSFTQESTQIPFKNNWLTKDLFGIECRRPPSPLSLSTT